MKLSKMNANELRAYAGTLGADVKKLYGTSKQTLIIVIGILERDKVRQEGKANV
jgi:hypothetical protein